MLRPLSGARGPSDHTGYGRRANLAKLTQSLTDDIAPLLGADVVYGAPEAQSAFERVWFRLIARLHGDAWH